MINARPSKSQMHKAAIYMFGADVALVANATCALMSENFWIEALTIALVSICAGLSTFFTVAYYLELQDYKKKMKTYERLEDEGRVSDGTNFA